MNAPEGKRPRATIQADIDRWVDEHVVDAGALCDNAYCRTCHTIIQQTTLYASVHEARFGNACAGFSEVVYLPLPYCNTCEPEVANQMQRTCIHEED